MKLLRKSTLLLLVMALLFLLAVGGRAHWKGTIDVWDFPRMEENAKYEQEVFAEFEEDFPGVKINFTRLSWGGGGQKLMTAIAAGSPPDLVGSGLRPEFAMEGLLEPIDPYLTEEEKEDILPEVRKVISYKGKIYGWPWYLVGGSIFLNLDIFEERGVTPPKNGVWPSKEAFLQDMKKLTFDRDGDGKIDVYGFGLFMEPDHREPFGFLYTDGVYELNEDYTEYTLDSPEAIESFQWIIDLEKKHGIVPPGSGGRTSAQAYNMFLEQRTVAAVPQWTHVISAVRTQNAAIEKGEATGKKFNLGVAGFPIGKGGDLVSVSPGVGSWVVFKQSDKGKRDILMELAKRLTWTKDPERRTVRAIGGFPVRKSSGNLYPNDELFRIIGTYRHVVKPFCYNWAQINNAIAREMQLALLGEKSAEQALKDAGNVVRPLLAK